jgi:hypothetical protein
MFSLPDMNDFSRSILAFLSRNRIKAVLVLLNILFGVLGLFLSLIGVLPLDLGNFLFFSLLIFLTALYRPVWVFLLLVGMLPYEIVSVARPDSGSSCVVPVAYAGASLATGIRLLLNVRFSRLSVSCTDSLRSSFDRSLPSASGRCLPILRKLTFVLGSFVALFFLVRFFVRTERAVVQLLPFFLSSFIVVAVWSVVQNLLFASGRESFQVMAGRPNGTFSESDWLGMYLLFPIAFSLAWLYRNEILRKKSRDSVFPFGVLFLATLVLLLSMTRSAWLGLAGMGMFFGGATLVTFLKLGDLKRAFFLLGKTASVVCFALIVIPVLHLSRFSIFDRAVSVGGVQEITIACLEAGRVPERIRDVQELDAYGCQHILLEENPLF